MGTRLRRWTSIAVLASLWSLGGSIARADDHESELEPLDASSPSEVLDKASGMNTYWDEAFTSGDTKFFLNLDPDENQVNREARRIEAFYTDYLNQLAEQQPPLRSRDLPSPFSTSLKELEALK